MPFRNIDNSEFSGRVRCNTWPAVREESPRLAEPEVVVKPSRRNVWGNLSYADLITRAISSSPQERLTLTQIYNWMIETVPHFRQKSDKVSSMGWKNSIRHNLSLHSKFKRVQNEETGRSSWWMINHQVKEKSGRRRSATIDSQKLERKRQNAKKKAETLRRIKEESIPDLRVPPVAQNYCQPTQQAQTFFQPNPYYYGQNVWGQYQINFGPQVQANQNYDHQVPTFQHEMALSHPYQQFQQQSNYMYSSSSYSQSVRITESNRGITAPENSLNLDDIVLNLDSIHLPFEVDVNEIIKKELEIDDSGEIPKELTNK